MTWNVERGQELTVADLARATTLWAALAERVSAFFAGFDVLACPVSQVSPFDVNLDWVHQIDGVPQESYLDWMRSAYLISVTGLPAISVPAGFPAVISCYRMASPRQEGSMEKLRDNAVRAAGLGR